MIDLTPMILDRHASQRLVVAAEDGFVWLPEWCNGVLNGEELSIQKAKKIDLTKMLVHLAYASALVPFQNVDMFTKWCWNGDDWAKSLTSFDVMKII